MKAKLGYVVAGLGAAALLLAPRAALGGTGSGARARVVAIAEHEAAIGIVETPRGSNTSTSPEGGIAKYSPGRSPAKWCVRFVKWVLRQANTNNSIPGVRDLSDSGSVASTLRAARETGRFWPAGTARAPRPGDLYVTIEEGHIGIVRSASGAAGARQLTMVDGNSQDAVRITQRPESALLGYIDPY
jgi:hypothetical protein